MATPAATDHPQALGTGEVLVSAGGGNVGTALFKSALGAAALDSARTWRLLVGGADAAHRCEHLRLDAPPNTLVEPARPEFRQMLRHAAASVSMCGYNTALDLLQAATPSVLVPFDDGFEVEQSLRARALSQLDGFEMISSAEATPDTLKRAVDRVITAPRRGTTKLQMNGAEKTVQIVMSLLKERTP